MPRTSRDLPCQSLFQRIGLPSRQSDVMLLMYMYRSIIFRSTKASHTLALGASIADRHARDERLRHVMKIGPLRAPEGRP